MSFHNLPLWRILPPHLLDQNVRIYVTFQRDTWRWLGWAGTDDPESDDGRTSFVGQGFFFFFRLRGQRMGFKGDDPAFCPAVRADSNIFLALL